MNDTQILDELGIEQEAPKLEDGPIADCFLYGDTSMLYPAYKSPNEPYKLILAGSY